VGTWECRGIEREPSNESLVEEWRRAQVGTRRKRGKKRKI
jgi:hypothetical protein